MLFRRRAWGESLSALADYGVRSTPARFMERLER